jgi:hypothetical protein
MSRINNNAFLLNLLVKNYTSATKSGLRSNNLVTASMLSAVILMAGPTGSVLLPFLCHQQLRLCTLRAVVLFLAYHYFTVYDSCNLNTVKLGKGAGRATDPPLPISLP